MHEKQVYQNHSKHHNAALFSQHFIAWLWRVCVTLCVHVYLWNETPEHEDFNLLKILLSSTLGLPQNKYWNQEGPHGPPGHGRSPFCLVSVKFPGVSLVVQWQRILLTMQEKQVWSLGQEDPLEKEIGTTPVFWRIPWTEEPGGLQSTGPPRVGHNWVMEHAPKHAGPSLSFKELLIREGSRCRDKGRAVKKQQCSLGRGSRFYLKGHSQQYLWAPSRTKTPTKWRMQLPNEAFFIPERRWQFDNHKNSSGGKIGIQALHTSWSL